MANITSPALRYHGAKYSKKDWDATVTVKLPKHFGDLSDV